MHRILIINPGSTSTKVALFEDKQSVWEEKIQYAPNDLNHYIHVMDQYEIRLKGIESILEKKKLNIQSLSAVAGRGGPFQPLKSGTYEVSEDLLQDIRNGNVQAEHISNIAVFIAAHIAQKANIKAYFVDPVSVDEMEPVARISGIPEIERKCLGHALNIRAVAHQAAKEMGKSFNELNFIAVHLGGGISVCPIRKGCIIDVNNANEEGPFSPERAGTLPVSSLAKLCYSGEKTYQEMEKRLVGNGGMIAYLGTNDGREVEKRIQHGDTQAKLVYEAMAYQIAKEIGAMSTVLNGSVDAILITGGMAHSLILTEWIRQRVFFIAPVRIYPGEHEMEAMALGVLRVLCGEEKVRYYRERTL
jgi:butyrate kinase